MAAWHTRPARGFHTLAAAALAAALAPALARDARAAGAGKGAPAPAATAAAPAGTPVPAERRAVRGGPLDEDLISESPELREVRRFEERTFPRGGEVESGGTEPSAPLPPGLGGRWGGSGDAPPVLRSPDSARHAARTAPPPGSEWLRDLALPDLPVRWEPAVLRYLDYFKNDPRGRGIMTTFRRRLGRYQAIIERVLDRHGLPRDLVYLAMIESGFEAGATSRVGAGGVWQYMPEVARAYGLEVSAWVDARRDVARATEAAARYLKDLYVRFGSWPLAFAAYHAGYGAIMRSITRYNTNDYWELGRHENGLPWETTFYVPKILAAAIVGHNAAAFGYADVAQDPPFEYETVEVAPATTLGAVARAAATRPEVIEALNPELIRSRTPPDRGNASVRVPRGCAAMYVQGMGAARGAADRVETVVLRFGETLDDVARARGVSARELRRLNGVKSGAELRAGTTVLVPAGLPSPLVAKATVAALVTASGASIEDDEILVAVPDRSWTRPTGGLDRVFYRTRDGDTLAEIAGTFHVSEDDIVEWNNLDPDARLQPKLVLQLFVSRDFDPAGVALLDPAKVRVVTLGSEEFLALEVARRGKVRLEIKARPGDTLAKIARRYGLTPGDMARINRLAATSDLSDGQKVVVYSPTPDLPREITIGRSAAPRRPPALPIRNAPGRTASARPTAPAPVRSAAPAATRAAPARPAAPAAMRPPTIGTSSAKPVPRVAVKSPAAAPASTRGAPGGTAPRTPPSTGAKAAAVPAAKATARPAVRPPLSAR